MPESVTPVIRTAAKAVVLHNRQVLLQRATWEGQDCYFLPGGGQHPGEPLDATVRREVHEETGLTVTVVRLLWLREYIGINHQHAATEAATHRIESIFECAPACEVASLGGHAIDDVQTGLAWIPLHQVPTVNLLPEVLREPIANLATAPSPAGYLGDVA